MKKLFATLAVAAFGAIAAPASEAALIHFAASLDGLSEFPPNASPGSGLATAELDTVTHLLDLHVSFSGLTAPTTAAHIHCCALPGVNAPVSVVLTGFPLVVTSGDFDGLFLLPLTTEAGLFAGTAYINIHTQALPGGEIRGNFHQVPEPGSLGLLGLGALLAHIARRRQRD